MNITKEQEKEVIKLAGPDYEESDIPALWRDEEKRREKKGREIEDIN